jgi:hypothetical protein
VWKGSPGKILNYEWGSLSWGGYGFSEGDTFLIYAQQQEGEISTHWCDRTKSAENTEVEQVMLDWLVEGLAMERIYERLFSLVRGDKNGNIRAQAIRFLGNDLSAFRSRSTRRALLQAFQDPDPTVRIAVIKILNYLVSKEAIHHYMWKAFNDETLSVRLETILYFSPLVKNGWGEKKKEEMLAVLRKDIDQEKKIIKSLGSEESETHQMSIQRIIHAFYLFRAEEDKRNSIPMVLEGLKSDYYEVSRAARTNLLSLYTLAQDYLPELKYLREHGDYSLKAELDWIIPELEKMDKKD